MDDVAGNGEWARWAIVRATLVLLLASLIATAASVPAWSKAKSKGDDGPVCDKSAKSDDDDDDDSEGVTFKIPGACVGVTGEFDAIGQASNVSAPRLGSSGTPSTDLTLKPDIRIEMALPTQYGKLKTAFEMDWSYVVSTGFDQTPTLDEATVAYLGVTAGYSDSLMNFWDSSDFQFTASAPNRSSYLVSYEHSLTEELTAAFAVEAGPSTTRGADTWRLPGTPPYYTGRLRYEKDDWTVHASGAFHELDARAPPLFTGGLERRQGWAASTGLTIPLKPIHEDDSATVQATYAVDSSIFLGTQSDISFLAAVVPTTGPTKGWSVVGSYVHNWDDKWKTELFVSQLELSVDVLRAHPSVKTTRAGATLSYEIDDHWQIGTEVDYLSARFDLDGTFGIIQGGNLNGFTGFVWLKWQL